MAANWVWKAVLCSTTAVFGAGCGRIATPAGGSVDGSTDAAGAGGASTGAAGAGGSATPPGPFTGWTLCQTLTTERAPRAPYALAASADLRWVAMLDTPHDDPGVLPDQSVALWNLASSTVALRLTNVHDGFNLALSPDGALVVLSGDGMEVAKNVGSGAQVPFDFESQVVWRNPPQPVLPAHGGWLRTLAFSPDGAQLASGRNYDIDLFRADTGASVDKLFTQLSSPGVAFSPDGLHLASSAPASWRVADRTAVWAPPTSDPLRDCHVDCFTDNWATFSPDGTLLLTQFAQPKESLGWDTTTALVDAASGDVLRSLGTDLARHPTFSPDGRRILAGDRLIDVTSGQQSPLGAPAALSLFLSDGRIAVADGSGAVSLLCPLPP